VNCCILKKNFSARPVFFQIKLVLTFNNFFLFNHHSGRILEEKICDPRLYYSLIQHLVRTVEVALYQSAPSLEAYVDDATVRNRIKRALRDMKHVAESRRHVCFAAAAA